MRFRLSSPFSGRNLWSLLVLIVAFITALGCYMIVPPGHVGVVYRLGAVQMKPRGEGFHIKAPYVDSVEEIDIRLRAADKEASASSRDLQVVSTRVTAQYSLIEPMVPLMYQKVGNRGVVEHTIIDPAIQESVKAVTAQYTAEELITRRAEVATQIHDAIDTFISDTLAEKGVVGVLSIANVAITDFDFSVEFNRSIEEKVKAEQDALRAENEKQRQVTQAEAANEQRKLEAEAKAFAIQAEAEAEAFRVEAESIARAEAIRREAEALRDNPQLIELRKAERWDGRLPQVVLGDGAIPLINFNPK